MNIKVIKKTGSFEDFDESKIISAIQKASHRTIKGILSDTDLNSVLEKIMEQLVYQSSVHVEEIHELVIQTLKSIRPDVSESYARYHEYRLQQSKSFEEIKKRTDSIKYDIYRENANKDSDVISTKRALLAEVTMKELVRRYDMPREFLQAHEDNWIYIHDFGDRWTDTFNCCLFDVGNVMRHKDEKGYAYRLKDITHQSPKTIYAAFSIATDILLSASSNQYGGITFSEIDTVLSPYADKTYNDLLIKYTEVFEELNADSHKLAEKIAFDETVRQIQQGYQSMEYRINTLSNALGQTPFTTITFGMEQSRWGREITKVILSTRQQSDNFVFPKLVFLTFPDVNTNVDSPNYDLFKQALETSRTKLYPDYLSLSEGTVGEIYKRSGKIVSPMGCRSYLSAFINPYTNEEVYVGRGNVSVVTVNIVKIAIESKGDEERFYQLLEKYTRLSLDVNKWYHGKVSQLKGSSNPLFWCEGGAWMSVGMDDSVAPIVKAFTTSVGFLGLNQCIQALYQNNSFSLFEKQTKGLEIAQFMRNIIDERKDQDGILHSLYATPSESLSYTQMERLKKDYGVIEGVTDKEYLTNSFHVDVWEHVSVPEKIVYESPFHEVVSGGKIGYVEFPYGVSTSTLEKTVTFAMSKGMYFGINVVSSHCEDCKENGDFIEQCPHCGSDNIVVITRVCGYLSVLKRGGEYRQNPGKVSETFMRVDHVGNGNQHSRSYYEETGISQIPKKESDSMFV